MRNTSVGPKLANNQQTFEIQSVIDGKMIEQLKNLIYTNSFKHAVSHKHFWIPEHAALTNIVPVLTSHLKLRHNLL